MWYRLPQISEQYAIAIAELFQTIIRHVVFEGGLRVDQVANVSLHDKQRMLSWNPSDPFKMEKKVCVHGLIASKALEIPNAEAVCGWDGTLTYRELEQVSDSAAARLVDQGISPGTYIPIIYEKSIWTVVAAMAILKAGAALVPLNPNDPVARLEEIIRDLKTTMVVTAEKFVKTFSPLVPHVIVFSAATLGYSTCSGLRSNQPTGHQSHRVPNIDVSPSDPIFVLFTSGSTGRPKGMVHTHRSIATHNLAHGAAMFYQGARVLQFAAHTFDVALMDIFTTLLFGGCICVPSESDRKSNIINVINAMRVSHAILTPSFAGLIEPTAVPTLKTLAVGGEALPQDRVQNWADKVNLIQIYGPAEVGICMTMNMRSTTPGALIGFPLKNSSCWLVDPDDDSRLVPIGAVGELLIAGPSLAQGYLNDEARTQLSFINAPPWALSLGLPFERFYKAGDLLRYNVDAFDGSFIFVGRKDSQIKLRGQRIEAGEVEFHIGQLQGVALSMVTKPDKGCFAGQLVAVVQMINPTEFRAQLVDGDIQLAGSQSLTAGDLRKALEEVLPAFMIPTECLTICNMPFVPSLKLDRRRVQTWLTNMAVRPSTKRICTIGLLGPKETTAHGMSKYIAGLLVVDDEQRLDLEKHDFRLQDTGIDSIKIISFLMFIKREHDITVPVDVILDSSTTIRDLAVWIDAHSSSAVNQSFPPALKKIQPRKINAYEETLELSRALLQQIEATSAAVKDKVYKQPSPSTPNSCFETKNVLLTGASGYLGSTILHQLLLIPHIQISLLLRCTSPSSGLQRIKDIGTENNWWHPSYQSRITIWPGDLSAPDLGLSPPHQQQLNPLPPSDHFDRSQGEVPACIDTIIHAGAKVHYTLPYTTLYPINITSTLSLLRSTALSPHIHTFIHVSGGESPHIDSLSQDPTYLATLSTASGYTLTKNIAERLVRSTSPLPPPPLTLSPSSPPSSQPHLSTHFRSKKITTLKPGYLIGSPPSAFRPNTADFLWRLLAVCIAIGAYNAADEARWVFIDGVETVATATVSLLKPSSPHHHAPKDSQNATENENEDERRADSAETSIRRILTAIPFGAVWRVVEHVYGRRFRALEPGEWMVELRARVLEEGERGVLFPLLGVLEREGGGVGVDLGEADGEVGVDWREGDGGIGGDWRERGGRVGVDIGEASRRIGMDVGEESHGVGMDVREECGMNVREESHGPGLEPGGKRDRKEEEERVKALVEGNLRWLIASGFLPAV